MPRKPARSRSISPLQAAFAPVRRAATGLPEVEESTSYGTPALKVRGKFLTRLKEDGETIVLRVDFESRDAMMRVQPDVFYITDHYRDYPTVLVRLKAVNRAQLRELLADAWRLVAPRSLVAKKRAAAD
ncbi:MAG TPA: MmcQ/YjbR family DNA-binding protein [Gemmatimonadales bacterium]|nr:MmcQ/YjbR family DNA-binding protein [Gemmatimonadales bacterium]HSE68242.1 MmcQ/YjbR family DNA-binding protein [Gemmatimonadales bacterium]